MGGSWLDSWDALVAGGKPAAIEEFWLARLDEGVGDGAPFVEALKRLRSAGKKTLAGTLLELAAEQAAGEGAFRARKQFLREMIRLGIGDAEKCKSGLEDCLRKVWAGRPSLEPLLRHFALRSARKPLETLAAIESWLAFDVGEAFSMSGRGPGRVVEANPQLGMLRLDFEKEKRVPVPIDAAARFLTPLPEGHFLRRRLDERDALKAEVAADPARAFGEILESFAAPMTVPEIKAALEGIVADDHWTAWWNKAKKNPRVVASGSGTRVQYRLAGAEGAEDEIRAEFAAASFAKRVELARRHGTRSRALGEFMAADLLSGVQSGANEAGVAWEALTLASRFGATAGAVAAAQKALVRQGGAIALLDVVGEPQQREAILVLARAEQPDAWTELYANWIERETHPRVLTMAATALLAAGQEKPLRSLVDLAFLLPQKLPAIFVWACESDSAELAPYVDDRRTGGLLVRIVELAERKEFVSLRTRLKEILSPRGLAGTIVAERLTADHGRRLLQILEHPGELADERNWLRRAVFLRFPELRESAASAAEPVFALAPTVERVRAELKQLLDKEIPAILKAIQVAREHGDLSENFEYHAARARQEYLSARAAQLQGDLARVRVVDPAKIDTSVVRVGTRARLRPERGGEGRAVTILGPYEADPEKGIVSHASEVAQALLEAGIGETVTLDGVRYEIEAIEPATNAEPS